MNLAFLPSISENVKKSEILGMLQSSQGFRPKIEECGSIGDTVSGRAHF